jgi:hypothetical protein
MNRLLHELLRWERTSAAATPAGRWRAWARALADRYTHGVGQVPRPGMVLVPASAPGERHHHLHWSVRRDLHLAVRPVLVALSRAVATPPAREAAAPPTAWGRRTVTSAPQRVETPAPPLQRVVVSAAALQADADDPAPPYPRQALLVDTCLRTLERLVEQRRRVEHWAHRAHGDGAPPPAAGVAGSPTGGPPVAAAAPAPLALPSAPVLVTAGGRAGGRGPAAGTPPSPGPAPAGAASSEPRPGWGGPPAREAAPARIDIGQLTDQVVRQIDREINAHRERMGRI